MFVLAEGWEFGLRFFSVSLVDLDAMFKNVTKDAGLLNLNQFDKFLREFCPATRKAILHAQEGGTKFCQAAGAGGGPTNLIALTHSSVHP